MKIGLVGKSGSGKGVVGGIFSNILNEMGYIVVTDSFAKPIKDFYAKEFGWNRLEKDEKYRWVVQSYGENSKTKNRNIWVQQANRRRDGIKMASDIDSRDLWFIYPDVRFHNELENIKTLGGIGIYIDGTTTLENNEFKNSKTEQVEGLKSLCHTIINNKDKSFDNAYLAVKQIVADLVIKNILEKNYPIIKDKNVATGKLLRMW